MKDAAWNAKRKQRGWRRKPNKKRVYVVGPNPFFQSIVDSWGGWPPVRDSKRAHVWNQAMMSYFGPFGGSGNGMF